MPILNARLLHSPTPQWEEVRRFYRDTLGLPETGGWSLPEDRGSFLKPPAAEVEIMEQDAAALGIVPPQPGTWTLLLEVDNLDSELARLESAGVKIERSVIERPWGARDAVIRDPAGTPLVLFEQLPPEPK